MNRMLLREARNESKRLKYEFPEYKVNGQVCQYYSYYSCITCEKHVYDKLDRIFCDGCHLWTHRWCARVSKLEYKCLSENSAETWYCKHCKKNMFPFFYLNFLKIV